MTSTHTADAAGGEAIYSSDGLSPLPIPPPPSYQSRNRKSTNDGDDCDDSNDASTLLDTDSKDVVQAFEVFSGKVFPPPMSSVRQQHQKQGNVIETKLEKMARIQAELQALEEEEQANENAEDDQSHNEVMDVVNGLSKRLEALQSGHDITTRQQNLTSFVQNLKIEESTTTREELSTNTKTGAISSSITTLEQRLLRIEQFLGSQIHSFENEANGSILERLKQAEDKLNSIDEHTLNQAASRAKVIRADLEAASKARSKISNTNVEDAAKITKLHDQLVDMDGFLSSNILSTIVNRLSSCASLHTQSMEFGNRLKVLEDMVHDVEATLGNIEQSVKTVEEGMVKNIKVIQKNMEILDQK